MSTGKIELSVGSINVVDEELYERVDVIEDKIEEIDAINNKITELEESVDVIEDKIEEIDAINNKITELEESVGVIEDKIEEINNKTPESDGSAGVIEEIDAINNKITELEESVGVIENEIEEIDAINNKITELEESVGVIEENVNSIPNLDEIKEIVNSIPNLDEINGINSSLDNIETKINNIGEYNVKNYGAKGDGVTDDTNAIISAINDFTLKGGNKLTFPSGSYKITSPLLIDLKENRNMSIEMNGYIMPVEGIGRAVTLINGVNVNATIRVKGGGLYKYYKGFSTDVTGLDCALYIRAISGLVLNMFTDDFRGRGLEVERKRESDNIKTDMFNFGKLIFRNVGQAMFVSADTGTGNFGDIWAIETDGSYFTGVDMSINSYENAKIGEPVIFDNCASLHLGRILLGENNDLIKFENCHNITLQHLYLFGYNYQVNIGCTIVNCKQTDMNIKSTGCTTAVLVNGLTESDININSKNDKTICYVSTSAYSVENVYFKIIGKDTEFTGFETSKGEWLFDRVTLTGKFNKVIVDTKDVYLDIVNSHINDINLPRNNNVRVCNNRYGKFSGSDPDAKSFCS